MTGASVERATRFIKLNELEEIKRDNEPLKEGETSTRNPVRTVKQR